MTASLTYAVATTYADACQTLHDKIAARYGHDALDSLTFQTLPCPHKGADTSGTAILAYPTGEPVTRDNLIVSYYGDPIHADTPRRDTRSEHRGGLPVRTETRRPILSLREQLNRALWSAELNTGGGSLQSLEPSQGTPAPPTQMLNGSNGSLRAREASNDQA